MISAPSSDNANLPRPPTVSSISAGADTVTDKCNNPGSKQLNV